MNWIPSTDVKHILKDIYREQYIAFRFILGRPFTQLRLRELKQKNLEAGIQKNIFPNLGLLFIHIPKTAGTSIHHILSKADVSLSSDILNRNIEKTQLHQHSTALEWKTALGENSWQKLFSFCLVRNPWDLMVSSYFWWVQKANQFPNHLRNSIIIKNLGSFDRFIHSRYGRYFINECPGAMSDWYSHQGSDLVHFVGRVEDFDNSIQYVLQQTKAPLSVLPSVHKNTTLRKEYRKYYSKSGKKIVELRFADVI